MGAFQRRRLEVATKTHFSTSVNGHRLDADVEPRLLLVHFLRDNIGLTGTHVGCDSTNCGACTVMLDGRPVKSCTVLAVQADGREVLTVEGLAKDGRLHPVQEGFLAKHGLQCGFCTPGMLIAAAALLERNHNPSEEEIKTAISGNICRCTGYVKIIESVQHAARLQSRSRAAPRGHGPRKR
jgi:aerobic carbon-monoxide dehydrogenase small subunit